MNFQEGDRVIFVRDTGSGLAFKDGKSSIGRTGTVCKTDHGHFPLIGVAWDDAVSFGHRCDFRCENGHGWYVFKREIQIIFEDDCSDMTFSIEDVL